MHPEFDFNLIKVFDTVFRTRSVTQAGLQLGRTQSAISNSLRKLRIRLDDPLFVRNRDGLTPTPKAEEFQKRVTDILAIMEASLDDEKNFDPHLATGHFRMGAPDRLSLPVMLPVLMQVQSQAPDLSIHVQTTDRQQALISLREGQIDLAIGWFNQAPPQFSSRFLFKEDLVCLGRASHPIFEMENSVGMEQLLSYPHLVVSSAGDRRAAFDEILAQHGLDRRIAVSLNNFSAVPALLLDSDLLGVFTKRMASALAGEHQLAHLPIAMATPALDHYMVWNNRLTNEARHKWFRGLILEQST